MSPLTRMQHEFVEFIPTVLAPRVLYISVEYATVLHLCCCGCNNQVVTPLAPGRWRLTFDGESISLNPSIGNWSFPCQSHYWIQRNRVRWARTFTREEVARVRERDRSAMEQQAWTRPEAAGLMGGMAAKSWLGRLMHRMRRN
jgi:hypothetical protein